MYLVPLATKRMNLMSNTVKPHHFKKINISFFFENTRNSLNSIKLDADISAVIFLALKKEFSGSYHQKQCSQFGDDGTSSCFSFAMGNCYCRGSWQLYFVSYPFRWITSIQPQLYLCKYVYIHLHTFESLYLACYSWMSEWFKEKELIQN